MTGLPSWKTQAQTWGPSSIDDQASETYVGPTSVTETTGAVGAVSSGRLTLRVLLYFDLFPAASIA
jgi:hypothetical protein